MSECDVPVLRGGARPVRAEQAKGRRDPTRRSGARSGVWRGRGVRAGGMPGRLGPVLACGARRGPSAAGRALTAAPLLPGHPSEDPKFPKVPWPTPDLCPACHEEIRGLPSWNEGQVLLFLKRHYGSDNLVDTYSEDLGGAGEGAPAEGEGPERGRTSPEQPRGALGAEGLRVPSELPPGPHLSERWRQGPAADLGSLSGAEGRRGAEAAAAAAAFLGLGFSSLDMSLCVLLYVASSLFLMGMCCFFRLRSKRWKVRLHHPSV